MSRRPIALLAAWAGLLLSGCAANPAQDRDDAYLLEPYVPPPPRADLSTGELIFECEQHLAAWQRAMAGQRTTRNKEQVLGIELALKALAHREQTRLEEQAVSGPPRNRAVASAALAFTADPKVLPLIANNLADPDPMVRANALLGAGVLAEPATPVRLIADAATDPTSTQDVRRNAVYAAFRVAERARLDPDGSLANAFAALLSNPDPSVRAQAAAGAGLVRAVHLVPPVTDLLAHDPDAQVRTAAAYALGEMGAPGSAGPLLAAMGDPDRLTAGTARASLVKLHGRDEGPDPSDWKRALGL